MEPPQQSIEIVEKISLKNLTFRDWYYQNVDASKVTASNHTLERSQLRLDIYCGMTWAVFTLGTSELAFVFGQWPFLISTFGCAMLLTFFLIHVQGKNPSLRNVSRPIAFCVALLILGKVVYTACVYLEVRSALIVLHVFAMGAFLLGALISIITIPGITNVTR